MADQASLHSKIMIAKYVILSLFMAPLLFSCSKKNDPEIENEYRFSESMTVDGLTRTYLLNLPPDYYTSSDLSLIIAMHGGGGDAIQFETSSELTEKANASGFVVVYPEGVMSTGPLGVRTWNAGGCCAYASDENIDDVDFISQLTDKLVASYKIDPRKVYATGHSNGGMMAYRLACEIPEKITAIAANGCSMVVTEPCSPSRPVPVLHMHSVLDTRVPYTGGFGTGLSNAYFPPLDSVLDVWSLNNSCTMTQVVVDNNEYKLTRWSECNHEASIQYYLTYDGGHAWPGGSAGGPNSDTPSEVIAANDLLWDFFQQYRLP